MPAGSRARLGGGERGAEQRRALPLVPGHVVAPDRVVVGDRAAALDQRIRRRAA